MVDPLPLVPATWITGGRRRSGWPSRSSSRHMRSSDRSMRLGCSAVSRATMASMGVMESGRPLTRGAGIGKARARLRGLRLGQEPAQLGERRAQLVAVDDHVDHAMVAQILGPLEAFRQLLADGLLDHPRAGEADERAGLGDVNVAEHAVGGGHAARGGIGEHDDIGLLGFAQHLHGDDGARHLHQRQDAFLHARAARGDEHDERGALLHRGLDAGDHGLPGRHPERAAHEIEVLHARPRPAAPRSCRGRA